MTIGEMNLNVHHIEDLKKKGPLDLQEETLAGNHLDGMDDMIEELGMDLQEEMVEVEKMINLDEMEDEDHMVTMDPDILYQLKQQFHWQQEM